jgi:hypothetical protein
MNTAEIDQPIAQEIIYRLLKESPDDEFVFYTESRTEYEVLLEAANKGLFPDLLSITRRGLRLNKRLVHVPLALAFPLFESPMDARIAPALEDVEWGESPSALAFDGDQCHVVEPADAVENITKFPAVDVAVP